MNEGFPKPQETGAVDRERERAWREIIALAIELTEGRKTFSFTGIDPESYSKLKVAEEKDPEGFYTTPTDQILERMRSEGMRVALGKFPGSGNVYILPGGSDDIRQDSIFPECFEIRGEMDGRLKRLIELCKNQAL